MRKLIYIASCAAVLSFAPAIAAADVVIGPEVDTWVMQQPDTDEGTVQGDFSVGVVVPDSVKIVEVPKHTEYGYVVIHKKRMLVDMKTRKIIKVY